MAGETPDSGAGSREAVVPGVAPKLGEAAAVAAPAAPAVPKLGDGTGSSTPAVAPDPKAAAAPDPKAALADAEKAVADAKTPEEKTAAQTKLDALKGDKKTEGAPEKYEAFKLPDGMEINTEQLQAFEPVARDLNLSQAQAQKLVDMQAKLVQDAAANQVKAWEKVTEDWRDGAKADADIGGAHFDENVSYAKTFLKEFGSPELGKFLDQGYGNHPELLRAFAKAGKAMSDDKMHFGRPAGEAQKSLAQRMYPSSNMN